MRADFTQHARAYAARPGYPEALVDRLVARAGVKEGDPVADLGAGTGLLTEELIRRGLRVTAVEPNAAMRARAPMAMREGTFEETGLEGASQRWVTAAHAFHWADVDRALPEIGRVLVKNGPFTALWNVRDESTAELRFTRARIEALGAPGFDEGYRDRDWAAILTAHTFQNASIDEEAHVVTMSAERYLDLWRSHHLLTKAIGERGIVRLVRELEEHLGGRSVDVRYTCRAWTVWA